MQWHNITKKKISLSGKGGGAWKETAAVNNPNSALVRLVLRRGSVALQSPPVVDGWATPGVKPQVHNITDLPAFISLALFWQLIYH